jgi:hypothetical protein
MRNPSPSPTPYGYASTSDVTWSRAEKAVARRAYDAALERELREVMKDARQRANRIRQPSDVWGLEHYLTQRRKEIDRKYQFRASHLTQVLGELLHEKRISERELRGLHEDKLNSVRSFAKLLTRGLTRVLSPMA